MNLHSTPSKQTACDEIFDYSSYRFCGVGVEPFGTEDSRDRRWERLLYDAELILDKVEDRQRDLNWRNVLNRPPYQVVG